MIVVDASAILELLFATPCGLAVADKIRDEELAAPQLLLVECVQVLRRAEARGDVTTILGGELIRDLEQLDLHYIDHDLLVQRIWELRHNLTAYDAAYVAAAELLEAELVTTDERMSGAPGNRARVTVVRAT